MPENKSVIFASVPTGVPVPGEHLQVTSSAFDPSTPAPPHGLVLEVLYLSLDPYQRGRMRGPDAKSYTPPFALGSPLDNGAIARVLSSDVPALRAGDLVEGRLPFSQYVVAEEAGAKLLRKLDNPHGVGVKEFLGALGMPGLTAYSSLYEIGRPKAGETIFISAASGAVGQIVGQLAKREGLTVVGSVGSDEKLDFVVGELGFDAGFNYKKERPAEALARLAPGGIDIYYENVGGEQLEAAIDAANDRARFVMCGMISQYNLPADKMYGTKNLFKVVTKRILMQGFIVMDENMGPKYTKEHRERVGAWIKDGSLKTKLSEIKGIENAPEGLVGMLEGRNFGKTIVVVKEA